MGCLVDVESLSMQSTMRCNDCSLSSFLQLSESKPHQPHYPRPLPLFSLAEPSLWTYFAFNIQHFAEPSDWSHLHGPVRRWNIRVVFCCPQAFPQLVSPLSFPETVLAKSTIIDYWKQRCPSAFERARGHLIGKEPGLLVSHRISRQCLP